MRIFRQCRPVCYVLFGISIPLALRLAGESSVASVSSAVRAAEPAPVDDLHRLRADVERLKGIVPDQAHAMSDVDYHFSNLWFAGKAENWPLAEFFWKETVSHMRWAVRIIPVRKDNRGEEVKLEAILKAIENTPRLQIGEVIAQHDVGKFEQSYRALIEEGCYSCHKASDKPYLRPQIPKSPASSIINFDPAATWPR